MPKEEVCYDQLTVKDGALSGHFLDQCFPKILIPHELVFLA